MRTLKGYIFLLLVAMQVIGCGNSPSLADPAGLDPSAPISAEASASGLEGGDSTTTMSTLEVRILHSPDANSGCRRCVICEKGGKHCGKPVCCDIDD